MFTIPEVIKLLTRIFAKENKRFPKGLEAVDIRLKAHKIHDVGKAGNYTGGISENQLKHFLAFEKQTQGVQKEISKDILKVPEKKGEVFDLTGKKIDTSKPILGGKNVPEDFADGGVAGLLGEPTYADGGRIGFKGEKFDPTKRTFLKGLGALATIPFIGKYFKWAKPLAKSSKVLTSVPIGNAAGMPPWFKPLVNKVIKQGEEVSGDLERVITHKSKLPNSKTDVYVHRI